MRAVFLTNLRDPLPRWKSAFPDLTLMGVLPESAGDGALFWLDLDAFGEESETLIRDALSRKLSIIALSSKPSEDDAYRMLVAGAKGYCHIDALPEQLQEIAEVTRHGGLWMPAGLVQRLLQFAVNVDAGTQSQARTHPEFDSLSPREEEVALLVGRGLNNREIAEKLGVSERTVKANLTSTFEKLDLRDRVQLALWVNRLPIH